jgi:predicted dehydrogenase
MAIRWGIIGCGNVCEVKSGPAFAKVPDSELVAVMRRDAGKARDYAQRHGVPKWYDDADKLIHDPDVDAVYVATPVGTHCEYALRICRAGKPAYIEKPMARNHSECVHMVDAFERAGLPLFVAYYRRALPRFLKARELIRSGQLGQLTGLTYRFASPSHQRTEAANLPWRLVAAESGGGLFMDLGSHTLDILDFLVGPLQEVSGCAANLGGLYDVEDAVAMHFRSTCGGLGTASWNFASGIREDVIEITGTLGRLTMSCFDNEPVSLQIASCTESFDLPNPPHIQQPLIHTIVDALHKRGACESTGVSAARTALVMDTVLEGYYGSRADGFWDRPETWPGRTP